MNNDLFNELKLTPDDQKKAHDLAEIIHKKIINQTNRIWISAIGEILICKMVGSVSETRKNKGMNEAKKELKLYFRLCENLLAQCYSHAFKRLDP